jgi:tetratricopeptide (TPR) repeat protein
MKRMLSWSFGLLACFGLVITSLYPPAALGATCEKWAGKVVSAQGTVEVQRVGTTEWEPAKLNETYCPGDVVRVGERSRADIALVNDSLLRLNEKTTITLGALKEERTSLVDMLKGAAYFFSRVPRSLEMTTPSATAGVRGTEFFIKAEETSTFISVFQGSVVAANQAGSLALASGQSAVAEAGKAPVIVVVVRPRDAVQWALYYPPVMYRPPEKITPEEAMRDPRLLAQRASQLLAVGRVDEAQADLERALSLDPKYSDAYALQSIIAVVQNDKEKALNLAQKAVETGPTSATARIALSYAQQARFDLEGARKSVEEAVKLDPENVLAWARLADLQASFGELGKALEAAKKAESLNPDLSLTQTVLGFAYLTQVDIKESKTAFEKAIRLDQAAPLPRLGLGLAKIREGDLKEGGKELEIAASLDPNNSLIRSYLGKVYYEEKRTDQDGPEYQIAKELDPKDPTPYFYDAIRLQTINRPVEALHDYQKAIELNDNRAVYRSKLNLDSDEAARQAALARIYSDLGFQQVALVEGWKSVNTDPTNYSAHRFLADSYAAQPRHEIARVSELLQSQLLQPINITPIQPRLAESNQFLVSAQGPTALSFNEFNPMFNRNRVALQASGIVGSNSTYGDEVVGSGIYYGTSMSAGQYYGKTDGFRKNDDLTDKLYNAFIQQELSYKTSIQVEYRYRDTEHGDIQERFFENDIDDNLKAEDKTRGVRIGFRHAFSPASTLIGNFQYSKLDDSTATKLEPVVLAADGKSNQDAYGYELSYLLRSQIVNVVTGAGYFDIDREDKISTELQLFVPLPPPLPPILVPIIVKPPTQVIDRDVRHTNLYLYNYVHLLKDLTLTIGASEDLYDTDTPGANDKQQFNPKFGITWNPLPDTTLRAAAFRVLRRDMITNQTIEPTQVAGFNQFFDEPDATESWSYGGAVDQRFSASIYGGAEYTYRSLNTPFTVVNPATNTSSQENANWKENRSRLYLFWTPHEWVSLTGEWLWERFDREKEFGEFVKNVTTNSVPLGINFFHPWGLSASLKATYIHQDGRFSGIFDPTTYEDGSDDFWLLDAAVSYRLPKRYGFITVGVSNLTDEKFNYFDTDVLNPHIQPDRFFFTKITLAIP